MCAHSLPAPAAPGHGISSNQQVIVQPLIWTSGNVVVETDVYIYYDAVENEDDATEILSTASPSVASLRDIWVTSEDSSLNSVVPAKRTAFSPKRVIKQVAAKFPLKRRNPKRSPEARGTNQVIVHPHIWTSGNIVIETEVYIYYDAFENEDDTIEMFSDTCPSVASLTDTWVTWEDSPLRNYSVVPAKLRNFSPKRVMKQVAAKFSPKRRNPKRTPPPEASRTPHFRHFEEPAGDAPPKQTSLPFLHANDSIEAPPTETPLRFLRAVKNDPIEAKKRYEETLAWRKKENIDSIIQEAHPTFDFLKQHYFQYYHLRGRNNEPVWYEKPPKGNFQAIRDAGITGDQLVRWYALLTEFGWQYLETDDLQQSISVIDLDGVKMTDFVGEVVDLLRACSSVIGEHYVERAGYVFVVNVPIWFNIIWRVVKNFIDEMTLEKIKIVRGEKEVFEALLERIPIENIPPEYGGTSVPLGQSPEEETLKAFMEHNNALARGESSCNGAEGECHFCTWRPVRMY